MEFTLGLFTGMAVMIALGAWLNERGKKRGVPKHRNPPPPPKTTGLGIYLDGKFIAVTKPTQFPDTLTVTGQDILDAIENPLIFERLFTRDDLRYINHSDELKKPPYPIEVHTSLSEMLKRAIENDDFEEAARIRDLMKKK